MKCWVCKRQARGYGHSDLRHPVGDARRYPIDWVFCSRRCQEAFVEHHEATKYPPVRGLRDPVSDPFADLEDDLPWEGKP